MVEAQDQTVSVDMLPAQVKADILDMCLGPNGPPAFKEYWIAEHGAMSFNDTYVAQLLFADENLSRTGGYGGNTIRVRTVDLEPADIDNSARSVSDSVVATYREKSAATAPPILVRMVGDTWKLIEGGHRLAAAKARGDSEIAAVDVSSFFEMTADDWIEFDA